MIRPVQVRIALAWVAEWMASSTPAKFDVFLKQKFKALPKAGSSDRRNIRAACYETFRIMPGLTSLPEESLMHEYLTQKELLTAQGNMEGVAKAGELKSLAMRVFPAWGDSRYFPAGRQVSPFISQSAFLESHFTQPYTWLRIRRAFEAQALSTLQKIPGAEILERDENTIAIAPGVNLDALEHEGYWEVQDFSSQQTASLFSIKSGDKVWDVCAGSGGKTLMLEDAYPGAQFYASDSRASILENFKHRRLNAGLPDIPVSVIPQKPESLKVLKFQGQEIPENYFDCIVIDAPCTGSGTWGRQPEWLSIFKHDQIARFAERQLSIVKMALPFLKPGGTLVYITCSVYHAENEGHLPAFELMGLESERIKYFEGFLKRADTLFGMSMRKR